ncbi:hypothetical protein PQR66_27335 [Paraburkholderia agricolaris]|uniref:Protein kinase domain-containing protein n=1 Tax=Paraburkholderia agricolaris TaxID=2152888 RepID=A0ABW8ZUE6_9BURK
MNASEKLFRLRSLSGGKPEVVAGRYLAEGAIAEVYALPDGQNVLKVFRSSSNEERARIAGIAAKVEAMLARPPAHQIHGQGGARFVQIAWPQRAVVDESGRVIGFSMPRLSDDAIALSGIMSTRNRQRHGVREDLQFRLYACTNLASVVRYVSDAGHLVLDFNARNFVVSRTLGWVGLLDCDGFAIWDGKRYIPADAVKPDEVAPEFRDPQTPVDFDVTKLDRRQTEFGLAVTIFRLLNEGNSPAAGRHLLPNEPSGDNARIAQRLFSVDPRRQGLEPAGDRTYLLDDATLEMFRRAFLTDRDRPTAEAWAKHLQSLTRTIRQCPGDSSVMHFAKPCPTCGGAAPIQLALPERPHVKPPPVPGLPIPPTPAPPPSIPPTPVPPTPVPQFPVAPTRTPTPAPGPPPARQPTLLESLLPIVRRARMIWLPLGVLVLWVVVREIKAPTSPTQKQLYKFDPSAAAPAAPERKPPSPVAPSWAVASVNANLRTVDGKRVITALPAATLLVQLDARDDAVQVSTPSGQTGWVKRDVLMPASDVQRLRDLSADDYLNQPDVKAKLQRIEAQLSAGQPKIKAVLDAMVSAPTQVRPALDALSTAGLTGLQADVSAGKWYAFHGEALVAEHYKGAQHNLYAAAVADPSSPRALVKLGYAAYDRNENVDLAIACMALPLIDPRATNTWMLMGFHEALDTQANPWMAIGSFVVAYRLSKDQSNTRATMVTLASQATNQRVKQTLLSAIQIIDQRS